MVSIQKQKVVEFDWTIVLLVILFLVVLDKGLTIANIKAVEKNFPKTNAIEIEKNPVAKYFFTKFGLYGGSIIYGILSFLTFILALLLLSWSLHFFYPTTSWSIALWILMLWYGLVILNNFFFLLKYNMIVP